MHPQLYRAAQAYVDAGLSVFPVTGKKPNTRLLPKVQDDKGQVKQSWSPFQKRLPTQDEIRYFFTAPDTTGVALVCGPVSHGRHTVNAGLYIIDVDRIDWIDPFRERCGPAWQKVVVQRTGSGGVQLAMICEAAHELKNQKIALYPNPKAGQPDEPPVLCGIESRGTGGYACGAPSLHPNGKYYELIQGRFTAVPFVEHDVVLQIIEAAQSFNEVQSSVHETSSGQVERSKYFHRLTVPRLIIDTYNAEMDVFDYLALHHYTIISRNRALRPGGIRGKNMPGVIRSSDGDAAYFYSSNDPLNQFTNAQGQPFHDRAGCAVGLEYGGDFYSFLESEGARFGIDYHRPDFLDIVTKRHVVDVQLPTENEGMKALTVLGRENSPGVVFLVDTPESVLALQDQGVAAMFVPPGSDQYIDMAEHLHDLPDRYVWFSTLRDGYTDAIAEMVGARVVTCGMDAATMLKEGATAQDLFNMMEQAEEPHYAVGAEALKARCSRP